MNVLLNASNLRFGGGLTVGLNLIEGLLSERPEYHFYLLHPRDLGYEAFAGYTNVTLYPMPESFHISFASKLWYNEYIFKRLCKKWQIHKVISLGNIGFPTGGLPHLILIHFPHLVYPESPAWKRMAWKDFLKNSLMDQYAAYHLRFATLYAVQTEIMRGRLCKRFDIPADKVYLLPNAAARQDKTVIKENKTDHPVPDGCFRLLFLSKYYAHKNFEVLIPLARLIRAQHLPIRFTLTIQPEESAAATALMKAVRDEGLDEIIQSAGHIPADEVHRLLSAHDGLFLPTLLESFSGAYVEAINCNAPIFTSHYDFATELLGDAAFYFDPLKAEHILHVLQHAIENPETIQEKKRKMTALEGFMPGWEEISHKFSQLIDTFA